MMRGGPTGFGFRGWVFYSPLLGSDLIIPDVAFDSGEVPGLIVLRYQV